MSIGHRLRQSLKRILPPSIALRLRLVRANFLLGVDLELELLPLFARGGAFIDVGANIGTWSRPAAKCFSKVHAFEPDKSLSRSLSKILPRNVVVYAVALSDHMGKAELLTPIMNGVSVSGRASLEKDANVGFEGSGQTVTLATLDSFGFRNIDVIKIDVEGHEAAVFAGGWELLAAEKPILICEIEERHHPGASETIIADICQRDYGCYFIRGNRLEKFQPGTIGTLQREEPALLKKKSLDYINNFIFIPNGRAEAEIASIQAWLQKRRGKVA